MRIASGNELGLGMDSPSLSFELFAICIKVYQLLLEASSDHCPQDTRLRLRIERDKLLTWAVTAHLTDDERSLSANLRLHKQKLHAALQELRTVLLEIAAKFTARQQKKETPPPAPALTPLRGWFEGPLLTVSSDNSSRNGADEAGNSDEIVSPRPCAALRKKAVAFISKARNFPSRLRWTATFDKRELEMLLARIAGLNDGIVQFFERQQQELHSQLQQDCFVGILQAQNSVEDLLALMGALTTTRTYGPVLSAHEERILRLVRFKAFNVALGESNGGIDEDAIRSRLGDSNTVRARRISLDSRRFLVKDIDTSGEQPSRTCGTYETSSVWVEWKYYDPLTHQGLPPPYLEPRLTRLATLLRDKQKPDALQCIARCVGYLHEPSTARFGLVFRSISPDPQPTLPLTLFDMLTTHMPKPSLSARVAIARALAVSLWHLHAADVLHRGLRSENVLFQTPFSMVPLLAGFEFPRPAADDAKRSWLPPAVRGGNPLHDDLYRHPAAQFDVPRDEVFTKLHDIYSLGVVLYEIGLWKPIHAVAIMGPCDQSEEGQQQSVEEEVREVQTRLLSQESLMGLAGEAGDVYMAAVASCLSGDFGFDGFGEGAQGRGGNYEARLGLEFGERVLRKLESIVV